MSRKQFAVCPTCDGNGTHVNPSIDSEGISAEQFYEDPDFEEAYFSGVYDVACAECGGQRVVTKCATDGCSQAALAESRSGMTDHRDRVSTKHYAHCYDHLSASEREDEQSMYEMFAEMEAERRMGA